MRTRLLLTAALPALLLSACAPTQSRVGSAAPPPRPRSEWAMKWSNVPVDPAWRFGRLGNGMRYAIRHNETPKGTAVVRMEVETGSLDESEDERGFAHFVEHMAFNGSTRVPEGEMVKLLERDGLAFGADTNAFTSFTETLYKLDLPRNDPALLDTALMLMRETASELKFDPAAVEREKGVVLSEMRDRNGWQMRNLESQIGFLFPKAHYGKRLPIGTEASLKGASAEALKAFWKREYLPRQTTLFVVGDFDPDAVEAALRKHFDDWHGPDGVPQPAAGPVNAADKGRTAIHLDPALSEGVLATRSAPWRHEPDSVELRRETVLRAIGHNIVDRRLLRITRQASPPFRAANFETSNLFRAAHSTSLFVSTVDGQWRSGLITAAVEYRRALEFGFTEAEVAEQVANMRNATRNAAASADTRSSDALSRAAIELVRDERVPATPQNALDRLEAFIPQITPASVLAALKRDAVPLKNPLLRFSGRRDPVGGTKAIRAAWDEAMRQKLAPLALQAKAGFAYTDFGPPGQVVSDTREPALSIRQVRFANGVRLNLKHTDLDRQKILVQLSLDGGQMLNTKANPLATDMVSVFGAGGLGKHSQDELQSIFAGRTAAAVLQTTPETFAAISQTTPQDLELQLQLFTAVITDPAYREEGQTLYYNTVNNYFARLKATPGDALANSIGGILSDNDPRFTLQPVAAYRALSFARLKADLADRMAHGAIEIGIVGDVDEDAAIALVARTMGALPAREADFRPYPEQRQRPFTTDHSERIIRHTGPKDQAVLRFSWLTRDGEDPGDQMRLELLEKAARILMTDKLREALGKAYSPSAASETSRVWKDYGVFSVGASVNVAEVPASRAAMLQVIEELRKAPVSDDILRRAREPMLEAFDNFLKTNGGWLGVVDRAQTEPDNIDRQLKARERLSAITAAELMELARRYLDPARAVPVLVLPEGVDPPRP